MFQGCLGFVLGGIVVAVLLANEPQLLGDVRAGMHDVRESTRKVVNDDRDRRDSMDRRYDDRHDSMDRRYDDRGGFRDYR